MRHQRLDEGVDVVDDDVRLAGDRQRHHRPVLLRQLQKLAVGRERQERQVADDREPERAGRKLFGQRQVVPEADQKVDRHQSNESRLEVG